MKLKTFTKLRGNQRGDKTDNNRNSISLTIYEIAIRIM